VNVVLDASAVIAFLRGEPGSDLVATWLEPGAHDLYMHGKHLMNPSGA
jgi:PIN domain nuclease of toxin-antitoxin system